MKSIQGKKDAQGEVQQHPAEHIKYMEAAFRHFLECNWLPGSDHQLSNGLQKPTFKPDLNLVKPIQSNGNIYTSQLKTIHFCSKNSPYKNLIQKGNNFFPHVLNLLNHMVFGYMQHHRQKVCQRTYQQEHTLCTREQ